MQVKLSKWTTAFIHLQCCRKVVVVFRHEKDSLAHKKAPSAVITAEFENRFHNNNAVHMKETQKKTQIQILCSSNRKIARQQSAYLRWNDDLSS